MRVMKRITSVLLTICVTGAMSYSNPLQAEANESTDIGQAIVSDGGLIETSSFKQTQSASESVDISYSSENKMSGLSGSNEGNNNYEIWSSPVYSYLAPCSDGTIMRVQAGLSMDSIVIQYFDSSYNMITSKTISEELPLFGAFYATDTNYYILSGQNNYSELANVECYRLTKYDKSWNKIKSVGLYDCNTYIPFRAGSARIATSGKNLVIRTCHEMYKSSDGYHHQANVTIQVDTTNMTITDKFTGVMNVGYGYVSHSFNQFVQIDNDYVVAVDHGDAYPRGIVLQKFISSCEEGIYPEDAWDYCTYKNILPIYGDIGDNWTGASLGGLEVSDTSYIVVGNSIAQTAATADNDTRNIFVSVLPKSTNVSTQVVSSKYITSYSEGQSSATTPQLVKVNNNSFILIWTQDDVVYYVKLDGNGNVVGQIKSVVGQLSDCQPVMYNNKVVWYTFDGDENTFYEINASTMSAKVCAMGSQVGLETTGIYVAATGGKTITAGLVTNGASNADIEYCWQATRDNGKTWINVQNWTLNNEWVNWTPTIGGDYILVCKARLANSTGIEVSAVAVVAAHPYLKGICQMPYAGAGGGYLIGVEGYDNYTCEMLILDCTLLAEGKDAWVYSTGKCGMTDRCLWTVWQPQYGYYWTLYRIYDATGNIVDEQCYGFANAY